MINLLSQKIFRSIKYFSILLVFFLFSGPLFSQDDSTSILIEKWLRLGAFEVKAPAFSSLENLKGETFGLTDLLEYEYSDIKNLSPKENEKVTWKGDVFTWEVLRSAKDGFVSVEKKVDDSKNELAYLAAFVQVDRWLEAKLKISSLQLFEVYLDGEKLKSKSTLDAEDTKTPGSVTASLKLEKGKHLIIVKTLKPVENTKEWKVKADFTPSKVYGEEAIITDISPTETMKIEHLMNGDFVNSATISPDGSLVLLGFSETSPPNGDKSAWWEVQNIETAELVCSFRESEMFSLKWLPVGKALSYETSSKEKGNSLWVFDFEKMTQTAILEDIKEFGSYTWSPDGSFVIYTISEEPDDKNQDLKQFEGMPDRWPWWRSRSFLYKLDVKSGVTERLSWGFLSTNLEDISPDGSKILFSQDIPQFDERPYSRQYLMEMNLTSYKIDTIWVKNFGGSCQYAPDGEHILVTGSPAMFGSTGINVTGDVIPNDYDNQAYIYDLASGDVDPITFNFNPSIQGAFWSRYDKNIIYFLAEDRTYRKVFSYDLNTRYFKDVKTLFDVVSSLSLADGLPLAVCTGSGISTPKFAAVVDLSSEESRIIANPRKETYKNVGFGNTAEWNFTNVNGVEIEGRIYYPPDFDKKKEYPLIVYYYAGTSPTERSFGGRYPLNLFAAQGYVVYNLQPSGATGFGQDFSAAHVNNWGITVADEIIDGTKQFLAAHEFINAKKVGCIGASYGGFMTMLLQTRTDIFAAAISHAGISSISSYWGEGYWGYLYSSVASANSFPWNNPKLYVEQSALFNADKINTPLLLLYGGSDTNVPPGESIQLYTALKLLGKTVELIEVKGQDHHIVDYKKRIAWQNTIFAWFDKWLKDQPQWWNDLYPDRNL